MRSPACVVGPDVEVDTAGRLMLAHRAGALAVVDRGRHLLGVMTTGDCLRALLTGQLSPG